MDWEAAIERNKAALLRVVAMMFALCGVARGARDADIASETALTILRLLRAAESAVRRLIFITSRLMKAAPPRLRESHAPLPDFASFTTGAGNKTPSFQLFDTLKSFQNDASRRTAKAAPRIHFFGAAAPAFVPVPERPARQINTVQMMRRLNALAAALDDLPKQARRLNRVVAVRQASPTGGKLTRPMRPGYPPGYVKRSEEPVHAVLSNCDWLARDFCNQPP